MKPESTGAAAAGLPPLGQAPLQARDQSRPQAGDIIGRQTLFWLLLTYIAILGPLYRQCTSWTLGICAICLVWRVGIYLGKVARPPRPLVSTLAIAAALTLALVAMELGVLNALVNLLVLGYGLKYIEMRERRDVKSLVLVGYFLIGLSLIEHQSLWYSLYLLGVSALNACVLLSLYRERGGIPDTLATGLRLMGLSLPLALVLFVVLPRFPPLWLVPQLKSSQTGLSDTLGFGDIRRLTRSAALAFRASFDGDIPANSSLYWRALVLEDYDGKHWTQSASIKMQQHKARLLATPAADDALGLTRLRKPGPRLDYLVIAEPSRQHWLFALDLAQSQDEILVRLPDYRLYSLQRLEQRRVYRVNSWPSARLGMSLDDAARARNLRLPEHGNPATRALAETFLASYPEPRARLNAMMRYFNQQPFFYTLSPPQVGPQQLDDFLFENRAGFCVHYASALAFMARATGLPARLVTGYQGGEPNPDAGYLSVYQYMAHAWVEVWLDDGGWLRFDPTAMVAPERVAQGFDASFAAADSYLSDNSFSSLRFRTWPWLNALRLSLASIDYYWSLWVLGFDTQHQYRLLTNLLGDVSATRVALLMLLSIGVIGLAIAYSAGLLRFPRDRDPLKLGYDRVCRQLARRGLARHPSDGPETFAARVAMAAPEFGRSFHRFSRNYIGLKYGPDSDNDRSDGKESKRRRQAFTKQAWRLKLRLMLLSPWRGLK
ncbi:DUF3488 and DUF4129 domain-containing transglutaminase family protein [Shewanella salipaludis]|uniref:transglutaminase TgpA family protein n=1 Tax=Shewanella salipaludis TaxID=2723052 RepID=UPI00313FFE96